MLGSLGSPGELAHAFPNVLLLPRPIVGAKQLLLLLPPTPVTPLATLLLKPTLAPKPKLGASPGERLSSKLNTVIVLAHALAV